ncbi:thioredoxin-like domain-containing protein [Sunxiuqinia sp. A32]|uniref:thioredoxin-like domain-containing protein n=1 Tax=Sunxiuqinia sp. A32 TaxID=3461496 RepID=UPI004045EBE7
MRKVVVLIALIATVFTACKESGKFKIEGKISNAGGEYVYLDLLKVNATEKVDSVKIGKDGDFKFTGDVAYPTFFLMKLNEKNFVTLLVDSAEQVQVAGDAANFSRDYVVVGSPGSELVQKLNLRLSRTKHVLDSIRSLHVLFRKDPNYQELKKKWDENYNEVMQEQIDYSTNFVRENPFSMASVLALYQKFDNDTYVVRDLNSLKIAASALNSFYPESDHVKALYANTLKLMSDERSAKMGQFIKEYGENSPEILLPNPDGKEIALTSLRGKYVLLQFWSSQDRGSRIINPVLVEIYNKYKRKGFDIYQVSVDENRYEWIDAIDKDGLSWTNVGDMKGSTSALNNYNVKQIPFNYLLDKEGTVIARNLKGPELDKVLGEMLN